MKFMSTAACCSPLFGALYFSSETGTVTVVVSWNSMTQKKSSTPTDWVMSAVDSSPPPPRVVSSIVLVRCSMDN